MRSSGKSKMVLAIFVMMLFGLLVPFRVVPWALFRQHVMSPPPTSLRIEHWRYVPAGPDYSLYFQFRVSPEDLDSIVKSRGYKVNNTDPRESGEFLVKPVWWQPWNLPGVRGYAYADNDKEFAHVLWCDDTKQEVYYRYFKW